MLYGRPPFHHIAKPLPKMQAIIDPKQTIEFPNLKDKWDKSGWGKNPADMLVARAGAKLARLVYPDVVHGLYAPEEMEGA